MINMNMPDFVTGLPAYDILTDIAKENPDVLYPDVTIASVFGNFPFSIWNGGGLNFQHPWVKGEIKELIAYYNEELGIPLRFTFTNPMLQEKHCWDTYSNIIVEAGHNGKNEILTSSRILENYLRNNYPNYKYCSSIVGTDAMPYPVNETDRYDLMVMQRRRNNNWTFLDTIPIEIRHKIEFLCNDPCPDDCPRLYSHYRDFGRAQLNLEPDQPANECSMHGIKGKFPYKYMQTLDTYISRETILKDYLPKGFTQFKVSGRNSAFSIIRNILDYMVKPEYRVDVSAYLWQPYLKTSQDMPKHFQIPSKH